MTEDTPRTLWSGLHRKRNGGRSTKNAADNSKPVAGGSAPTAAAATALDNFSKEETGLLSQVDSRSKKKLQRAIQPPVAGFGGPLLAGSGGVAEGGGGTRGGEQRKGTSGGDRSDSRAVEVDGLSALCDYGSGDDDDAEQGGGAEVTREGIDGSVGGIASRRGREVACGEGGIAAVIGDANDDCVSGRTESNNSRNSARAESDLLRRTTNRCSSPMQGYSAIRTTSGSGSGSSDSKRRALVSQTMPEDIGPATVSTSSCGSRRTSNRIPVVRVAGIMWCLSITELLKPGFQWPEGVKSLSFWPFFEESLEGVILPGGLEELNFGFRFNASLDRGRISWPRGLKKLTFGARWNRPLLGTKEAWPASLEVLRFGTAFNRPLASRAGVGGSEGGRDAVSLPLGLRELHLGGMFNQLLTGVEWPVGLQKLTLSDRFNCPLRGGGGSCGGGDRREGGGDFARARLCWPERLREISFGPAFDQDISQAQWPGSLEVLRFGKCFNRPLHGMEGGVPVEAGIGGGVAALTYDRNSKSYLPAGLKELELGNDFSGSLSVTHLPRRLESLQCGPRCRLPSPLPKSDWPPGLTRLVGLGDLGYVGFPASLKVLRMDDLFHSSLRGVTFPATLRVLDLGESFNQPLVNDAALPEGLAELRLGKAFKGDIESVDWWLPRGLKRLIFSEASGFNKAVSSRVHDFRSTSGVNRAA